MRKVGRPLGGPLQAKILQVLTNTPIFCEDIRLKVGRKHSNNSIRTALALLEKRRLARKIVLPEKKKRRVAWILVVRS